MLPEILPSGCETVTLIITVSSTLMFSINSTLIVGSYLLTCIGSATFENSEYVTSPLYVTVTGIPDETDSFSNLKVALALPFVKSTVTGWNTPTVIVTLPVGVPESPLTVTLIIKLSSTITSATSTLIVVPL